MVELENICVKYKKFVAVNNINIIVNNGEFFTLLGPSGCGKTTILRTIAGFERPKSGQVIVDKKDVTNLNPEDRQIGFVFQNYALFPTMTVFDNIAFGLKIRRYNKVEINDKVEKISRKMEILDCLNNKVSELSGGQQQRVAFARALVLEPKILLLDEPLSNLDAKLRIVIRKEIKRLQRELGITMIYVTHDQEEALAISDKIAVLNCGKIEQIGLPTEIYWEPKSEFVAKFIGELNYINSNIIKKINKEFKLDLDEDNRYYIRSENVIVAKINKIEKGWAILPARITNIEFLGAYTKTTFELDGIEITNISFRTRNDINCKGETFIKISVDDLISFKGLHHEN